MCEPRPLCLDHGAVTATVNAWRPYVLRCSMHFFDWNFATDGRCSR